jgi:hypothetical protein
MSQLQQHLINAKKYNHGLLMENINNLIENKNKLEKQQFLQNNLGQSINNNICNLNNFTNNTGNLINLNDTMKSADNMVKIENNKYNHKLQNLQDTIYSLTGDKGGSSNMNGTLNNNTSGNNDLINSGEDESEAEGRCDG